MESADKPTWRHETEEHLQRRGDLKSHTAFFFRIGVINSLKPMVARIRYALDLTEINF
jgi:hypothetical protein